MLLSSAINSQILTVYLQALDPTSHHSPLLSISGRRRTIKPRRVLRRRFSMYERGCFLFVCSMWVASTMIRRLHSQIPLLFIHNVSISRDSRYFAMRIMTWRTTLCTVGNYHPNREQWSWDLVSTHLHHTFCRTWIQCLISANLTIVDYKGERLNSFVAAGHVQGKNV